MPSDFFRLPAASHRRTAVASAAFALLAIALPSHRAGGLGKTTDLISKTGD